MDAGVPLEQGKPELPPQKETIDKFIATAESIAAKRGEKKEDGLTNFTGQFPLNDGGAIIFHVNSEVKKRRFRRPQKKSYVAVELIDSTAIEDPDGRASYKAYGITIDNNPERKQWEADPMSINSRHSVYEKHIPYGKNSPEYFSLKEGSQVKDSEPVYGHNLEELLSKLLQIEDTTPNLLTDRKMTQERAENEAYYKKMRGVTEQLLEHTPNNFPKRVMQPESFKDILVKDELEAEMLRQGLFG